MARIGWIGTGVMGEPMAGHLLDAGHDLFLYTRTRDRAEALLARGASWVTHPSGVVPGADVVCLTVGYPHDVEALVLGDGGLLGVMEPGSVLVDFTTSSPSLARRIAAAAEERGCRAIDAPVSGGDVGAREARLSIMVGGETAAVERVRPILECLGRTIVHQGGPGMGQHTKMMNQIVIATGMIGVCEGLLYARQAGLNPETALKSVGGGAAASWSLSNYAPRILKEDLEPGFMVDHFVKDMGIALDECRRMGLVLPGLELAHRLYEELRDMGYGTKGTQSLVKVLEKRGSASRKDEC